MELVFLGIVIFLFALAVFDLSVGVSNDAVNFLNSAVGSKAASFKRVLLVASVGVFIGAVMSNGMMDIARHGIFRPEHFSFYELMCIFMTVMVTDIILLDIFNSLGLPTSTTVSMVFELLGASFAVSLVKLSGDNMGLTLDDLLNTEKALSVIIGIFLSVAIAFFFGTMVQFLSRLIFTFNYRKNLTWKIGIFGGIASTAIIYFLLIKGAKDLTFMTPDIKSWISDNTLLILAVCFACTTLLMQILHFCKVNVFKVIVLLGTFSLAVAFAGNDLVNFIGVPLSGFSSYQDFIANGNGDVHRHLMEALNGPANTPIYFLFAAGVIMVVSLATSKKAQNVIKTEVGLGSQSGGDEMFGSSRIARRLVRTTLSVFSFIVSITPERVRQWLDKRFNASDAIIADGASFDLIRGSVNLTLAGMLIALGTSLKLPLSTTYVSFMVAMGSSLADRAWGRESAVFRITGVISVIGGWFLTAGSAFIGAAIIVSMMYYGGTVVMVLVAVFALALLVRSNIKYNKKAAEEKDDDLLQTILASQDEQQTWKLLQSYLSQNQKEFAAFAVEQYVNIVQGFINDDVKLLSRTERKIRKHKPYLKSIRRKETLCFQRISRDVAIENNTWFYLSNNSSMSILYSLRHINEVCMEHVENNFRPLPANYKQSFKPIYERLITLLTDASTAVSSSDSIVVTELRRECNQIKDLLTEECHSVHAQISAGASDLLSVSYVYLNLLQETREMLSTLRKLLRAADKLQKG